EAALARGRNAAVIDRGRRSLPFVAPFGTGDDAMRLLRGGADDAGFAVDGAGVVALFRVGDDAVMAAVVLLVGIFLAGENGAVVDDGLVAIAVNDDADIVAVIGGLVLGRIDDGAFAENDRD